MNPQSESAVHSPAPVATEQSMVVGGAIAEQVTTDFLDSTGPHWTRPLGRSVGCEQSICTVFLHEAKGAMPRATNTLARRRRTVEVRGSI